MSNPFKHEIDKTWIRAMLSTPGIDIALVKVVMHKCGYDDVDTPIKRVKDWIDNKYGMTKEEWLKEDRKLIEKENW